MNLAPSTTTAIKPVTKTHATSKSQINKHPKEASLKLLCFLI